MALPYSPFQFGTCGIFATHFGERGASTTPLAKRRTAMGRALPALALLHEHGCPTAAAVLPAGQVPAKARSVARHAPGTFFLSLLPGPARRPALFGIVIHPQKAASTGAAASGFILNVPKDDQREANERCQKGYGRHESFPKCLQQAPSNLAPSAKRVTFDTPRIFYR